MTIIQDIRYGPRMIAKAPRENSDDPLGIFYSGEWQTPNASASSASNVKPGS